MSIDRMIELDSPRGMELGLTSERFHFGSYLWETDTAIIVSFIWSRGQRGHFRQLMEKIEALGKEIHVPTPSARMVQILARHGYERDFIDGEMGEVEVWCKRP